MKFLANSKYLRNQILKAFEAKCNMIECSGNDLIFHGADGETNVEANVHFLIHGTMIEPFDFYQWANACIFLKTIPEQPITVRVDFDQIEIICAAVFKSPKIKKAIGE